MGALPITNQSSNATRLLPAMFHAASSHHASFAMCYASSDYPIAKLCKRVQRAAWFIDSDLSIILNTATCQVHSSAPTRLLSEINSLTCENTSNELRVVALGIVISQWVAETASVLVSALATADSVRARSALAQQTSLDSSRGRISSTVLGLGGVLQSVVVGMAVARQSPVRMI